MQTEIVIQHFGSAAKVAKALGISRAAISQWNEIVHELRAFQLEKITNGVLHVQHAETSGAFGPAEVGSF